VPPPAITRRIALPPLLVPAKRLALLSPDDLREV
jgi:hypothetical protein